MQMVMFYLFMVYDLLFGIPYASVRVVIGLTAGLFIRNKLVGLLACLLGDGLLFLYVRSLTNADGAFGKIPITATTAIAIAILIFSGVIWCFVGWALRFACEKLWLRLWPAKAPS